jgi:C_GCAxxG_C_C family probable redox protein
LLAVGEHKLGKLEPQSIRLATPFGGGVGGTREELCGALAGGVMAIGALYGRTDSSQNDEQAYALAKGYREAFVAAFGTTQCAPIREAYAQPDGSHGCDKVVAIAARALMEVLDA